MSKKTQFEVFGLKMTFEGDPEMAQRVVDALRHAGLPCEKLEKGKPAERATAAEGAGPAK